SVQGHAPPGPPVRADLISLPTSLVYGGVLNNRERRSVVGDQDQGHTQPSDHSPEYDENTTGPCKKMPAPAPTSGSPSTIGLPALRHLGARRGPARLRTRDHRQRQD